MKLWIKYGVFNAIIGLIIGGYTAISAFGDGYYVFAIAAPIAVFLTGGLFWKIIVNETEKPGIIRIIITGLLTGTVSHYLTFVLISIEMNICYWTTGNCTSSLGDPPDSILSMITGAWVYCIFSLLFFGWITAPASILIGLLIRRNEIKKEKLKLPALTIGKY